MRMATNPILQSCFPIKRHAFPCSSPTPRRRKVPTSYQALLSDSAKMVLQSYHNFSKRMDSENRPPLPIIKNNVPTRLRNNIYDASRRRRARAHGSRTPKHLVEQARRRSVVMVKTPAHHSITSGITFDVEMTDASQSTSPSRLKTILFPRELPRTQFPEINQDLLLAIDPTLADVAPGYTREGLEAMGPDMFKALGSVKTGSISPNSLPKEISIVVEDLSAVVPSHMTAVFGPTRGPGKPRKVTLFPVHSLILAAHCSKLPAFPPSPAPVPTHPGSTEFTVPVVPLSIPSLETYPALITYLYNKRADLLMKTLMPVVPPLDIESKVVPFATGLGRTFSVEVLLRNISNLRGLWQNVNHLGISDDRLWETMNLTWKILLTALAVGTGKPETMIPACS